jgi:hypothetical protein
MAVIATQWEVIEERGKGGTLLRYGKAVCILMPASYVSV